MSVPLKDTLFVDEPLDSDKVSRAVRIRYANVDRISLHNIITGTPDGSLMIQFSNDLTEFEAQVTNWVDYADSLKPILGIEQLLYNVKDITFRWIRLVYIRAGSTGTITTNFVLIQR